MGRKFGGRWQSGGRKDEKRQKTLTCLKCNKPFPLSEFANHIKECKVDSEKKPESKVDAEKKPST
jgi:hypothetical protein